MRSHAAGRLSHPSASTRRHGNNASAFVTPLRDGPTRFEAGRAGARRKQRMSDDKSRPGPAREGRERELAAPEQGHHARCSRAGTTSRHDQRPQGHRRRRLAQAPDAPRPGPAPDGNDRPARRRPAARVRVAAGVLRGHSSPTTAGRNGTELGFQLSSDAVPVAARGGGDVLPPLPQPVRAGGILRRRPRHRPQPARARPVRQVRRRRAGPAGARAVPPVHHHDERPRRRRPCS